MRCSILLAHYGMMRNDRCSWMEKNATFINYVLVHKIWFSEWKRQYPVARHSQFFHEKIYILVLYWNPDKVNHDHVVIQQVHGHFVWITSRVQKAMAMGYVSGQLLIVGSSRCSSEFPCLSRYFRSEEMRKLNAWGRQTFLESRLGGWFFMAEQTKADTSRDNTRM